MGEIEVTEEMLRQAFAAYDIWRSLGGGHDGDYVRDMLKAVYVAMELSNRDSKIRCEPQASEYRFEFDQYVKLNHE